MIDDGTREIIGAAIEVHRQLGPGLLESVYETCLCRELQDHGLPFRRQVPLPVTYKGETLNDDRLRIDLLIRDDIIVEVKAVEKLLPIHDAQLLTYMKLAGVSIGLLLNFNVVVMKHGIRRLVLGLKEPPSLAQDILICRSSRPLR